MAKLKLLNTEMRNVNLNRAIGNHINITANRDIVQHGIEKYEK